MKSIPREKKKGGKKKGRHSSLSTKGNPRFFQFKPIKKEGESSGLLCKWKGEKKKGTKFIVSQTKKTNRCSASNFAGGERKKEEKGGGKKGA